MALPYTYKSKIEIPESEAFTTENAQSEIHNQLNNSQLISELVFDGDKITFHYKALFNVKYPVELKFEKTNNIQVYYEAKLMKLIQISIALVVFIALFSSFGMDGFLWFSAIFILVFFSGNVLFIENGIQNLIKSTTFYQNLNIASEEKFGKEQLQWMNDTNKCPACGENLLPYDQNCPECGLKLPRKPIAKPFDVSKYETKRLSYTYKTKKSNH